MIDMDHYKNNSKTIDLTAISKNIEELANRNNLSFNDLVKDSYLRSPQRYKIPTDSGEMITHGVIKHPAVAVAITTATAGTRITNHVHSEYEIVKVLDGEMHLVINTDPVQILKKDEIILIPSHVVHDSFFPVDAEILIMTLPACDTWPEVEVI